MNFIKRIARQNTNKLESKRVYRGLIHRIVHHKKKFLLNGFKDIVIDRIKFVLRSLVIPLIFLRINQKKTTKNIRYIDPFNDETTSKTREFFIKYFLNETIESAHFENGIGITSITQLTLFLKLYCKLLVDVCYALTDFSKVRYANLSNYFINRLLVELVDYEKLYIFNSMDINGYLLSTYLGGKNKKDVSFVYSLGPLLLECKYDSLENINIVYTTKLQMEEHKFLLNNKLIRFENCTSVLLGNDQILQVYEVPKEKTVDIGFFDSAYWARDSSGHISIEKARNAKQMKINEHHLNYQIAHNAMFKLAELAKKKNYIFRIYMHPAERNFIKEHNIFPPYWELEDGKNVIIEHEYNKFSNYFESHIAVTVNSSLLYARAAEDLVMFYYNSYNQIKKKNISNMLPYKEIGKYKNWAYSSSEELVSKVKINLEEIKAIDESEVL